MVLPFISAIEWLEIIVVNNISMYLMCGHKIKFLQVMVGISLVLGYLQIWKIAQSYVPVIRRNLGRRL